MDQVAWLDTAVEWLTIGALGLLAVELAWLGYKKFFSKERILEMLASYSMILPLTLAEVLMVGAIGSLYFLASEFAVAAIPTTLTSMLAAIVIVDFIYYWEHRIQHQVAVFWSLAHTVHHSSNQFNQSTAYRLSWADVFISPWFYLPLVIAGFDPLLVLGAYLFNLAYQTWIHTELIGKLRWADGWLNTPSNHRVHHAVEQKYHDKNFGGILMLWDRLFGTYQAEEETPTYGVTHQLNTSNPLAILFRDVVEVARRVAKAKSWRERLILIFGHPSNALSELPMTSGRAS